MAVHHQNNKGLEVNKLNVIFAIEVYMKLCFLYIINLESV